jgi:diacylglycerol kinase
MKEKNFKIRARLESFKNAFNGVRTLFINEHNAWLHVIAALLVIVSGIIFRIPATDWIAVIIAIGLVFASEAINSSIEKLSDFVSPEKRNSIKEVKDLAAAGVLISAITALLIGLIVFIPKIVSLIANK